MTAEEFTAAAIALLRSAVGWQSAIARRLDVDRRTVTRWLSDDATPAWADTRLSELMGGQGPAVWPRDEWVTGDTVGGDGRTREYVVHLQAPRFVARIVACDEDGLPEAEELPADVVSGTVYSSDGYVLCEIEWIDEVVPGQVTQLLEAAADEIDRASDA